MTSVHDLDSLVVTNLLHQPCQIYASVITLCITIGIISDRGEGRIVWWLDGARSRSRGAECTRPPVARYPFVCRVIKRAVHLIITATINRRRYLELYHGTILTEGYRDNEANAFRTRYPSQR